MDISSMVCNASNNLLGMNTSVWDQIMFDLNPEFVEISWQVSSASNKVYHCDVDGVTNCVDVTSYLSCVQSGTTLTCKVPTTLGFSSYKVTASTPSGGNTPAGGGGGSKKTTTETATIAVEPAQQEASLDEVLAKWAKEETGQETSGTGAEEEPAAVAESQITEEQLVTEGNEIVSEEAPAEEQDLAGAATGITSVVFSSEKAKSIAGLGVIIIILGMLLYMVKRTEGKS